MADRVTLKDIAEACGVSKMTVSRILNGKALNVARPETRERVLAAARGYRPDPLARQLSGRRSNLVGAIIDSYVGGCGARSLILLEEMLSECDMRLLIGQAHENYRQFKRYTDDFINYRAEAIICFSHFYPHLKIDMSDCFSDYRKLVFFLKPHLSLPETYRCVDIDVARGTRLMARYLVEKGYRRIGLYVGYLPGYCQEEQDAFRSEMTALGLPPAPEDIFFASSEERFVGETLAWQAARGFDALMTLSDFDALRLIAELRRRGFRVPQDLAVAGRGDDPMAQLSDTRLTTVVGPSDRQLANALFQQLMAITGVQEEVPHCITLDTGLVVRDSA